MPLTPLNTLPPITTTPPTLYPWPDHHQRAWQKLQHANPHLHDAPIWSVTHASPDRLTVTLDRYARLAIQSDPAVGDLNVRLLGVKAAITTTDAQRTRRILLARRAANARVYPNLWEIAPAGGVHVHPTHAQPTDTTLTHNHLLTTLTREAAEELNLLLPSPAAGWHEPARPGGVPLHANDPSTPHPLAILQDPHAHSIDILFHLHLTLPPNWQPPTTPHPEHTDFTLLTRTQADHWLTHQPNTLAPPTRLILRYLP